MKEKILDGSKEMGKIDSFCLCQIKYYKKDIEKEVNRVLKNNKWIKELYESLRKVRG